MVTLRVRHRILLLTDRMADLKVEERVARAVESLMAKAKVNNGNASPSGMANRRRPPNKVVVPPLPYADLPAHLHVQACIAEWSGLEDRYVEEVVRHGLCLDWVADFEGELDALVPTYKSSSTHCPHVRRLLNAAAEGGTLAVVLKGQLRCVSAPFAINKKHAAGEEGKRLILNLRNVNMWVGTEHFSLLSLARVLPYLRKGQWACVIDLKGAYNHLPLAEETTRWLGVRNREIWYQCQSLLFGLNCPPRDWQRMMNPILNYMKNLGALIWVYLDDWILIRATRKKALYLAQDLVNLLTRLGIQIAANKGDLQPDRALPRFHNQPPAGSAIHTSTQGEECFSKAKTCPPESYPDPEDTIIDGGSGESTSSGRTTGTFTHGRAGGEPQRGPAPRL